MSFINPIFLFAAAAGVIPVIVHFMFRRQAKTLYFPSIVFLRQLDREVIHRRRLKEILIMILRVLVLVLFAIYFAKPVLKANLFFGGSAKSVVIILDDSYSMQCRDNKAYFDKAKEHAHSIINSLSAGDKAAVILNSGIVAGKKEISSLSSDVEHLHRIVDSFEPGFCSADFDNALNHAVGIVKQSGEKNTLIFIITDLQRKHWLGVKQQEKETGIPLIIVDVGSNIQKPNTGVVAVEVRSSADDIARRIYNFRVKIRNFSSLENNTVLGMYTSDDKLVDETQVKLAANEEKELRLVFQPGEPGWHGGYFRIGDDALPPDNSRCFALYMRDAVRIGILSPDAAAGGIGYDRFFFLSKTIDPLEQGYPFLVDKISSVAADSIYKYDIIVVSGALPRGSDNTNALSDYIRNGGRALIFLDGNMSPNFINSICGKDISISKAEKGIFKIGKESFGLSNLFLDVDIYERVPVSIPANAASWSLALFQDGKPFVIKKPVEKGAAIIISASYDVEMTNLPFRHASVPLLYQLLFRLIKEQEVRQYLCGDSLKIKQGWSSVVFPDGTTQEVKDGDELVLSRPGLYAVRVEKGGNITTAGIAPANPDTAESDLSRIGYDEIERLVQFSRWDLISREEDIRQIIERYSRGTPLWNYFLYAAMLCFFAELVLANRTGMRV
jgi:hypothetical protein